jgi:hypothetical protein
LGAKNTDESGVEANKLYHLIATLDSTVGQRLRAFRQWIRRRSPANPPLPREPNAYGVIRADVIAAFGAPIIFSEHIGKNHYARISQTRLRSNERWDGYARSARLYRNSGGAASSARIWFGK